MNSEQVPKLPQTPVRERLTFETTGRLAPGIHGATFEALRRLTCFNHRRMQMWGKLVAFLTLPSLKNDFAFAYFGGGFLSTKPEPADIDLVLQTADPYGADAFTAISRLFVIGLNEIETVYGIHLHFWMPDAPDGFCDFRAFFQYERDRQSTVKLDPTQGVARLSLLSLEIRDHERRSTFSF